MMRSNRLFSLTVLALTSGLTLTACSDDLASDGTEDTGETDADTGDDTQADTTASLTQTGDGDGSTGDGDGSTGDGDGSTGDGDGSTGDGDGSTGDGDGSTGDGDGSTGDGDESTGDGDGSTGDGDGDGDGSTGDGDGSTGDGDGDNTVYDIACSTAGYESLCAAIDKAGLAATLDDPSASFTVFAPDNEAFADLLTSVGAGSLDDVSVAQLTPILLYHVLDSEVDGAAATAAAGNNATIDALGGTIQLGLDNSNIQLDANALVELPDVGASNGIVHGINAVILPSITDIVVTDDNFSSLEGALGLADSDSSNPNLVGALDDNSGSFTVFAPPNAAFTGLIGALPAEAGITGLADISSTQILPVLKYHVVAGAAVASSAVSTGPIPTLGGTVQADTSNGVVIDGATVTTADIIAANGIIHVVDGVLVPSIADTVTTAPEFEQLAGLVAAADGDVGTTPKVGGALDGAAANGAWTLFAPTNDAITTLVGALAPNVPSGQELTNILLFHAVDGAAPGVYASTALTLDNAIVSTALSGQVIVANGGSGVSVSPGAFGAADVVTTDYLCSNGVIHAVSEVLVPPADAGDGLTCGGAFAIDVGVQLVARTGTTIGGGSHNNNLCADADGADDATYEINIVADGDLVVTVAPEAGFDATVHTLSSCFNPNSGDSCENGGAAGASETLVVNGVQSGDTVELVVDGAGGSEGSYVVSFEVTAP